MHDVLLLASLGLISTFLASSLGFPLNWRRSLAQSAIIVYLFVLSTFGRHKRESSLLRVFFVDFSFGFFFCCCFEAVYGYTPIFQ